MNPFSGCLCVRAFFIPIIIIWLLTFFVRLVRCIRSIFVYCVRAFTFRSHGVCVFVDAVVVTVLIVAWYWISYAMKFFPLCSNPF